MSELGRGLHGGLSTATALVILWISDLDGFLTFERELNLEPDLMGCRGIRRAVPSVARFVLARGECVSSGYP